jgi:hypothetical protein
MLIRKKPAPSTPNEKRLRPTMSHVKGDLKKSSPVKEYQCERRRPSAGEGDHFTKIGKDIHNELVSGHVYDSSAQTVMRKNEENFHDDSVDGIELLEY